MSTIQKHLVKTGAAVALAGLFAVANQTEASAQEYSVENWEPRTVSQITEEIEAQVDEQEENETYSYTFHWGDTLWGVSEATDVSIDKLVEVNDIDNRSKIEVDTTIYLSSDDSVVSVENDDEVVSYDISEDEVEETETPDEVEESVEEETETDPVEEPEEVVEEPEEEVVEEPVTDPGEPEDQTDDSETVEAAGEGDTMTAEATAYSLNQPVLSNHTYTGIDLRENPRVVAVDPDVIPLGSTIYVPGHGEYVAGDTGGDINGNRIDIHITDLNEATSFGRQTLEIEVYE